MKNKVPKTLSEIKRAMLIHLLENIPRGAYAQNWGASEWALRTSGPPEHSATRYQWVATDIKTVSSVIERLDSDYDQGITNLIVALCMPRKSSDAITVTEQFEIDSMKIEITVHPHKRVQCDESVSEIWNLLADMMDIVDRFEPYKAKHPRGPFMWIASAEEEAVEVAKEASKMARKIDETEGYCRMMQTLGSTEHIFGEMIKETLDLMVVLGTGIQALEHDFKFQSNYDLRSFCIDYVIWKTARSMGIVPMKLLIPIELSDYQIDQQ